MERKEREKKEMRDNILRAARELMNKEGAEGISIRKIAEMIEYSPANIYHYFNSKEELIGAIISEDYEKILQTLSTLRTQGKTPEEKLRESTSGYISLAVNTGNSYKNIMLNSSQAVLAHTAVLHKGAAAERPSISMLCGVLREFPALSGCGEPEFEAVAQVVWSLAFGLSMRFIVENVEEQQRLRITNQAIELIVRALENGSICMDTCEKKRS